MNLCRIAIRKIMGKKRLSCISSLPLPETVIKFMSHKDWRSSASPSTTYMETNDFHKTASCDGKVNGTFVLILGGESVEWIPEMELSTTHLLWEKYVSIIAKMFNIC